MRKLIYIVLILAGCLVCFSRNDSGSLFGSSTKREKAVNKAANRPVVKPAIRKLVSKGEEESAIDATPKDTARYVALTRRFGWYYGIGDKLTAEEAAMLPYHYRLTEPDSLGHYTHIEAVDGFGHPTTAHDMEKFNQLDGFSGFYDNPIPIETVTQWTLAPDMNGLTVMIESGYDADGQLVYLYLPVQLNDSTFVVHYADSFGEPIPIYRYSGKYMKVTVDSLGYEREHRFIDEDGFDRHNFDNVYVYMMDYDSVGNLLSKTSATMNRKPINRSNLSGGYMTETYTYNQRGQAETENRIRSELGTLTSVPTYNSYDSHGRLVITQTLDTVWSSYYGKEYTYDSNGRKLTERTFTDSKLVNEVNPDSVDSYIRYTYQPMQSDPDSICYYDSAGKWSNSIIFRYCLKNGENTFYTTDGYNLLPYFTKSRDGEREKITDVAKNLVTLNTYDGMDRVVNTSYFDLDNNPVEVDSISSVTKIYDNLGRMSRCTEIFCSFRDTIRQVTEADSAALTRTVRRYDNDGNLLSVFSQSMDPTMEVPTGQYGFDALGLPARSHLESALYYRVRSGQTYRGETAYLMGYNEYGERSYVQTSESNSTTPFCTKIFGSAYDKDIFLDEYDKEITDAGKFRSTRPKAYCVELLSQDAYDAGLRSGDLIVKYADFYYPRAITDRWIPADHLHVEKYINRNREKDLLVMRFNPRNRTHEIKSVTLPPCSDEQLGFLTYMILLTDREAERYDSVVGAYIESKGLTLSDFTTDPSHYGKKKVMLLRPFMVNATEMPAWNHGIHDGVIALGVYVETKDPDYPTLYAEDTDGTTEMINLGDDGFTKRTYYFTRDGETVDSISFENSASGMYLSSNEIPDEEYERLDRLKKLIPHHNTEENGIIDNGELDLDAVDVLDNIHNAVPTSLFKLILQKEDEFDKYLGIFANALDNLCSSCRIIGLAALAADSDSPEADQYEVVRRISQISPEMLGYRKISDDLYFKGSRGDNLDELLFIPESYNMVVFFAGHITLKKD